MMTKQPPPTILATHIISWTFWCIHFARHGWVALHPPATLGECYGLFEVDVDMREGTYLWASSNNVTPSRITCWSQRQPILVQFCPHVDKTGKTSTLGAGFAFCWWDVLGREVFFFFEGFEALPSIINLCLWSTLDNSWLCFKVVLHWKYDIIVCLFFETFFFIPARRLITLYNLMNMIIDSVFIHGNVVISGWICLAASLGQWCVLAELALLLLQWF